jgi:general secretion pathway protein H
MHASRRHGFTLIELMVVVLIISITIGIIGVNLGRSDADRVHEEADRLALALNTARDECMLSGRVLAAEFHPDGYRFLRIDTKGKLVVIENDEILLTHVLPDGMTLLADLEGNTTPGASAGLVLDPSGTLPALSLTLRLNDATWRVRNDSGLLRSEMPERARAG